MSFFFFHTYYSKIYHNLFHHLTYFKKISMNPYQPLNNQSPSPQQYQPQNQQNLYPVLENPPVANYQANPYNPQPTPYQNQGVAQQGHSYPHNVNPYYGYGSSGEVLPPQRKPSGVDGGCFTFYQIILWLMLIEGIFCNCYLIAQRSFYSFSFYFAFIYFLIQGHFIIEEIKAIQRRDEVKANNAVNGFAFCMIYMAAAWIANSLVMGRFHDLTNIVVYEIFFFFAMMIGATKVRTILRKEKEASQVEPPGWTA